MLKSKLTLIAAMAAMVVSSQALAANDFFVQDNRMGCATITNVRNTTQQPLYDRDFERYYAGRGGSAEAAMAISDLGVVGKGAALIGSAIFDGVRDASTEVNVASVSPKDGNWPLVKAVQVQMDDGNVMNLPLQGKPKLVLGPTYEAGRRVVVYALPKFKSVQLFLLPKDPPKPGEKHYDNYCSVRLPADQTETIVKSMASVIEEGKIIP